jgi:hypothetical protein
MKDMMLEEIRQRRRDLIKKRFGGSIDKMVQAMMEWQKKNPGRTASLRGQHKQRAVA